MSILSSVEKSTAPSTSSERHSRLLVEAVDRPNVFVVCLYVYMDHPFTEARRGVSFFQA